MQIIHRVSINASPEVRRELASMGTVVGRGDAIASSLITFEVDEANEAWPQVQAWIARRKALDTVSTRFSKKELEDARWLELVSDWHHGYPQPNELDFGYREATYDLSNYCAECGIGLKQKAPFQMKGEPKWGRNSILQLNWVFDEFFVTPEVYASVFKKHGIGSNSVMDTEGKELQTVVQLIVEEEVGIVTDGLVAKACPRCGRMKYLPVTRGPFPALRTEPSTTMPKTQEYFGSGASAHKRVLVSQALERDMTAEKVRGISFRPVAESDTRGR